MIENKLDELLDDEYIENNLIYCKKCNTPRSATVNFDGKEMHYKIECDCQRKERERIERIEELKKKANISERYKNVSFETTNRNTIPHFNEHLERCMAFCNNADEALKNGWGIYLYGTRGTGKTHLAACMANELMNKEYDVLFTNFFEITSEIKQTYNRMSVTNEQDLINKIISTDFLFIDDIGTESLKKNGEDTWIQEKIYDILNRRYNVKKPTIFTSNNSLTELVNDRGMMDKSVDRIMEMATVILKFEGKSYRREMRNVEVPF